MSATMVWRPTGKEISIESHYTSADIEKLNLPRKFNVSDIPYLNGYSAFNSQLANELIKLVESVGEIEVKAVW